MKCLKLLKLVLVCTCVLLSSCNLFQEPSVVQIHIANDCTKEQQSEAHQVILERIKSFYKVKDFTQPENGTFTVTYLQGKKPDILSELLSQKGEITIYESYFATEISDPILKSFDITEEMDNPLVNFLIYSRQMMSLNSPAVGGVSERNKDFIDSLFKDEKIVNLIPNDASLLWEKKIQSGDVYYELVAVRKTNPFSLNSQTVKKTNIEYQQNNPYLQVTIELYPEYRQTWADLTRNNINRALPFVCDDRLLMHPFVNEEITGGKLSISGRHSEDEMYAIQSFLKSGTLNCSVNFTRIK